MNNEKYQLRYLPSFFEDVKEIVLYIKNELSNEKAANDLIDAVENAILHNDYRFVRVLNHIIQRRKEN